MWIPRIGCPLRRRRVCARVTRRSYVTRQGPSCAVVCSRQKQRHLDPRHQHRHQHYRTRKTSVRTTTGRIEGQQLRRQDGRNSPFGRPAATILVLNRSKTDEQLKQVTLVRVSLAIAAGCAQAKSITPSLIQRMTLSEMMIISHYKNVVSKRWRARPASQYGLLIAKEVPPIYSASHDIHVHTCTNSSTLTDSGAGTPMPASPPKGCTPSKEPNQPR